MEGRLEIEVVGGGVNHMRLHQLLSSSSSSSDLRFSKVSLLYLRAISLVRAARDQERVRET